MRTVHDDSLGSTTIYAILQDTFEQNQNEVTITEIKAVSWCQCSDEILEHFWAQVIHYASEELIYVH